MKYNTQRAFLLIPEYGRNIQEMARYTVTMEDRERRSRAAAGIVKMMATLNPNVKNFDEYERKLWDHLHLITDFQLDVDSPYPKPASAEEVLPAKPGQLAYPHNVIKFKHYGKNVETMIEKASNMEDEEKRDGYTRTIAAYMKMVYVNWNKDIANDDIIKSDIASMSEGKLQLAEDVVIDVLQKHQPQNRRKGGSSSRKGGGRNNKRHGGGGGGGYKRRGRN